MAEQETDHEENWTEDELAEMQDAPVFVDEPPISDAAAPDAAATKDAAPDGAAPGPETAAGPETAPGAAPARWTFSGSTTDGDELTAVFRCSRPTGSASADEEVRRLRQELEDAVRASEAFSAYQAAEKKVAA